MDWNKYKDIIISHYQANWRQNPTITLWERGPLKSEIFNVLEFPPSKERAMWTYATCGMSYDEEELPIELHIFSKNQSSELIELLTVVAYYQKTSDKKLELWSTLNFGKPWMDNSFCTYGLISLPYLDGPKLENFNLDARLVNFYWLIPITKREKDFKSENGIGALEEKFEQHNFNYLDPSRASVI